MKTSPIAILSVWALVPLLTAAPASASSCPADVKQLQTMTTAIDRVSSRREGGPQLEPLRRVLRDVSSELNYGSRDDLGELETFSFFHLSDETEARILQGLGQIATLAAQPNSKLEPVARAARDLARLIPGRNLHRDRQWTPEKLACLAGADLGAILGAAEDFGMTRIPLEKLKRNPQRSASLPADFDASIQRAVRTEENIWPDTILEGDYGQNGPATARDIEVVLLKDQFVAVELTISAPAVFTGNGDCEYDDQKQKWLGEGCAEGAISVRKALNHRLELIGSMDFAEFDH